MSRNPRSFIPLTLVGALMLSTLPLLADAEAGRTRGVKVGLPTTPTKDSFSSSELEHYLSDDGIAYVRPGLKITVNSVVIGADRKTVVDFNITDNFDQPLDRAGKVTPGVVSPSFILSWYNPDTRLYTAYTTRTQTSAPTSPKPGVMAVQAGTDAGGAFTDLEVGHYKYTFKTVLPEGYDKTKTTTLGLYATRNLTDIVGKNYYSNVEYDFRPDGQAIASGNKWDKIRTAACNNCHDPLALHGGSRRDVNLCVLCHQPQTTDPDTGNTVDMATMVHKIHYGESLTKGYTIIGFGNAVSDFTKTTYPQDIRNCDNCHEGIDASQKPTQSDLWYTKPSRRACGACHDAINWETGENHVGGKQLDDSACASCHQPESELEFDASIKGAHTIPEKSKQLKGLSATITSFSNMTPGKSPTVVFTLKNGDGTAVDGTKLTTFSPILAGPTTSYSKYYREDARTKGVFDATKGTTTYTFTAAIPADAKGTWTLSGDIYRNATLKRGDGGADITLREAAYNPIKYVAVTGTTATPRRAAVTITQCNACHDRLALHGGQRLLTEECVICHNPTKGDEDRRPASAGAKESVSFQRLIHRIHTGEELTQDFTVYGFGGSANNFNEILFPGDRRNCAKCHTAGSYIPPLATGIDSVTTLRDYFTPQGPSTAACLGCHDNQDAAAHAYLNTTQFGGTGTPAEACATCHGSGKDWAVDKVHAR